MTKIPKVFKGFEVTESQNIEGLNIKEEWFENSCIKCGAIYQNIQACPMCAIDKNPQYCQICHTTYQGIGTNTECPFKENHFKFKIHYVRKILSMIGIKWRG